MPIEAKAAVTDHITYLVTVGITSSLIPQQGDSRPVVGFCALFAVELSYEADFGICLLTVYI